jgi:UDP-2,3-diacylglucosamine hydrolase
LGDQHKHIAYFASDFHLGTPSELSSKEREHRILSWLDIISQDATHLFLVGDVFDFWFEYKHAIPKGFVRIQAKLAQLVEKGIEVHLFHGNHDMWMFDYFKKELGIQIHTDELLVELNGQRVYLAHGDGVGPGDLGYKLIKKIFRNKLCQWLFARLHPNFGIGLAKYFSKSSRKKTGHLDEEFRGLEHEWIFQYLKKNHKHLKAETYIFGHRHLPLHIKEPDFQYFNLGEWLHFCSYVKFSNDQWKLLQWKDTESVELSSAHHL